MPDEKREEFMEAALVDRDSPMYRRAWDDATICFSYVPDFGSAQDQVNWCAGIVEGRQWLTVARAKEQNMRRINERISKDRDECEAECARLRNQIRT